MAVGGPASLGRWGYRGVTLPAVFPRYPDSPPLVYHEHCFPIDVPDKAGQGSLDCFVLLLSLVTINYDRLYMTTNWRNVACSARRGGAESIPNRQIITVSNLELKRRGFLGFLKLSGASLGHDSSSAASSPTRGLCKQDCWAVEGELLQI